MPFVDHYIEYVFFVKRRYLHLAIFIIYGLAFYICYTYFAHVAVVFQLNAAIALPVIIKYFHPGMMAHGQPCFAIHRAIIEQYFRIGIFFKIALLQVKVGLAYFAIGFNAWNDSVLRLYSQRRAEY